MVPNFIIHELICSGINLLQIFTTLLTTYKATKFTFFTNAETNFKVCTLAIEIAVKNAMATYIVQVEVVCAVGTLSCDITHICKDNCLKRFP